MSGMKIAIYATIPENPEVSVFSVAGTVSAPSGSVPTREG